MDKHVIDTLLIIFSSLWAINMGASGFAVSFGTLYGTKKASFLVCVIFFTIFIVIGAVSVGEYVAKTLSSKVIPKEVISKNSWIITVVLFSAGINLLISNLLKVPSSTSIIIMMSFLGAGLYLSSLIWETFLLSIVVWIASMLITYFSTLWITKLFYPPRYDNLWLYQKFVNRKHFLFWIVLVVSIYNAYSLGTNNVANVVGPFIAIFNVDMFLAFVLFSLLFGVGALVLGKGVIKTVGDEIIPIGLWSATIVSIVTSTLTIVSSLLGLPFPTVIVVSSSIIAIGIVKKEVSHYYSFKNPITRKILRVWLFSSISPTISTFLICLIIDMVFGL
ncbi:MAG: inorganic phosphate transporter [Brevinematales bacterium]|nr:inorganic phosphate transporter [Brevinematales bacterium]